ncbi:MAG: hypothetical protein QOF57_1842 [Frankiaceae bacterium]|jgi:hypothetical protein|nr:hypothetical protein [Frankiaceae bacterium]MDQ1726287.1 hypothetical protein [Frankiaceae bacterium]
METVRADKPRRQAGVRDMLLSLGVIFAFIALGWPAFVNRETQTVRAIDFHEALAAARVRTPYPLLSPDVLPQGWRATSAYLNTAPATGFHIGLVTPANQYAVLEQTNAPVAEAVRTVLGDGSVPGETALVGGTQWQLEETAHKQHALVRTTNGVTVIVTGTADWPELQTLAASLR